MRGELRAHLLDHRADFWRLRASVHTRVVPYFEDPHKKVVYVPEDRPEIFFRRPIEEIDEREIVRWEVAVEALCEMTGERPVMDSLGAIGVAGDEE